MQLGLLQPDARAAWSERLAQLERALDAADPRLDLVLCPELFTTGYGPHAVVAAFDEAAALKADAELAELARRQRTALVYGTVEHDSSRRRNVARLVGRDGRILASHAKRAVPVREVERLFAPGDAVTVVDFEGLRLGLLVCFDVEFPENVRATARAGAQLILVPTALWDRSPIVARMVVAVRAYENGVFVAYANWVGAHDGERYLGESVVCAPDGRALARAGGAAAFLRAAVDVTEIARARAFLPFLELSSGAAVAG